jgi:hypothetical protein
VHLQEQKRTLYESNISNQIQTYNEYNTSLSNINILKGFLNSNITTQQYIKDLRCDNLNINTGNILGINYINVNNIVADGKKKRKINSWILLI